MRVLTSARANSVCMIALASALLGVGQAAARQPSQDQIAAIKSNCSSDYLSYCSSVPRGGSQALQCLKSNLAKLSSGCQQTVKAAAAAAPSNAGTPAPSKPAAEAKPAVPAESTPPASATTQPPPSAPASSATTQPATPAPSTSASSAPASPAADATAKSGSPAKSAKKAASTTAKAAAQPTPAAGSSGNVRPPPSHLRSASSRRARN
jgi:outer membrane biosynthesis protein TonB